MAKIKLVVEHLRVESFGTGPASELRGTVRANVTAYWELCYPTQTEDPRINTCGETQNSCVYTCFERTCFNCPSGACPSVGCASTQPFCELEEG
jgi:hypothetical protein